MYLTDQACDEVPKLYTDTTTERKEGRRRRRGEAGKGIAGKGGGRELDTCTKVVSNSFMPPIFLLKAAHLKVQRDMLAS